MRGKPSRMKQALLIASALALAACAHAPPPGPPVQSPEVQSYVQAHGVSAEEAQRRLAAQEGVFVIHERLRADPNFGGLFIEHEPVYRVGVLFTGANPDARLAAYTRDPLYEARSAQFTQSYLEGVQRDLGASLEQAGIYFMSSSVDVRSNRVVFDVVTRDEVLRALAARRIEIPAGVEFVERGGIVADAQTLGPVRAFPQARNPAGAEMMALARGRLEIVDGCLRLRGPGAGEGVLIVWPSSAVLEEVSGKIRVRDARLGTWAEVGDEIEMGGGNSPSVSVGLLTAPIPNACRGPYWIAASGWRRVQ